MRHRPSLRVFALALVGPALVFACSSSRTPGDFDAGPAEAGPCGDLICGAECEVVAGRDGCPVCRCGPPPAPPCTSDADCVIADDLSACCLGCSGTYHRATVEADRCLVRPGEPRPTDCRTECITPSTCPDIDCFPVARAVCEAGVCVPSAECGPGQVMGFGGCVPACASDADCVLASLFTPDCCGLHCPHAHHRQTVADMECLAGPTEDPPAACLPAPGACEGVGCPGIACADVHAAVCGDDGVCVTVAAP